MREKEYEGERMFSNPRLITFTQQFLKQAGKEKASFKSAATVQIKLVQ